jgi:hypothetical protein
MDHAAWAAGRNAFEETLAAGLPVFYIDSEDLNVVQYPEWPKVRDSLDTRRSAK